MARIVCIMNLIPVISLLHLANSLDAWGVWESALFIGSSRFLWGIGLALFTFLALTGFVFLIIVTKLQLCRICGHLFGSQVLGPHCTNYLCSLSISSNLVMLHLNSR